MLWLSTQLPTQTISHPARALHQVQPLPAPAHSRAGSHTHLANAGTRNPCWLIHSVQDSNTYIHLPILTISCTTASVERCLSRWQCYKYTCEITVEKNDWVTIALMLFRLQWKSELFEINIVLFVQRTTLWTAQFWKGYFQNTTLDWYCVQIMWPQFLRLTATPFNMRNSSYKYRSS